MNTENRNKIFGAAGTLLLHIAIAGILLALTLEAAPPAAEKGIATEMLVVEEPEPEIAEILDLPSGESGAQKAQGGSDSNVESTAPNTDAPLPKPAAEKLIVSNEKTVSVPTPPKADKNKNAEPQETPEQKKARQLREEEARKAAEKRAAEEAERKRLAETSASMANAFNSGKQQQTTGDGEENPEGSGQTFKTVGSGNVGKESDFGGRTPITGTYVDPIHDVNESGTVIVNFIIDIDGSVRDFAINPKSTSNQNMRNNAMAAAKKIKFKPSDKPTGLTKGEITYNFGIK